MLDGILGEGILARTMERVARAYLGRRAAGQGLPEVPLTELGPDDVGLYKDVFVLNDRALLFCDWLRRGMGAEGFGEFTRRLFALERLDRTRLEALVEEFLPGTRDDLGLWLDTTEYPEHFRLLP